MAGEREVPIEDINLFRPLSEDSNHWPETNSDRNVIEGPMQLLMQQQTAAMNANANNIGGVGTFLFLGDLEWWTTDAEVEAELVKYGDVKEVTFFEEKASGKFRGYCQVEFCDEFAAKACKEGMNGHVFNGRPCVVTYAVDPFRRSRMGGLARFY